MLSGIVALAQKINVQIIAGGIERAEEATRLLAEGCDLGQGFLYSRPVSGDALWELFSRADGKLYPSGPEEPEATEQDAGPELKLVRGGSTPAEPGGD